MNDWWVGLAFITVLINQVYTFVYLIASLDWQKFNAIGKGTHKTIVFVREFWCPSIQVDLWFQREL